MTRAQKTRLWLLAAFFALILAGHLYAFLNNRPSSEENSAPRHKKSPIARFA